MGGTNSWAGAYDCVKQRMWALRAGSVAESTYYSSRGSRFHSQPIQGGSQSSATPLLRYLTPSSGLCVHQTCMWYVDITCRQNTHTFKNQYIKCEMCIDIHPSLFPEFGCNVCSCLLPMEPQLEQLSPCAFLARMPSQL